MTQALVAPLQAVQAAPRRPQVAAEVEVTHWPVVSQHPPQLAGLQLPAGLQYMNPIEQVTSSARGMK